MFTLETFLDSLRGLGRHKLRILLTMLGIVFGVGAVIAMLAIGEGAKREALGMIEVMGLHNIIVEARDDLEDDEIKENLRTSHWLTREDGDALKVLIPGVAQVAGLVALNPEMVFPRLEGDGRVIGVGAGFDEAAGLRLLAGRFFGPEEDLGRGKVMVVGRSAAANLFDSKDVIGEQVRVEHEWFTIIGVVEKPLPGEDIEAGDELLEGYEFKDLNQDLMIPLGSALSRFPMNDLDPQLDQLLIRLEPEASVPGAVDVLERAMERLHRGVDDTQLIIPLNLLKQSEETQKLFNLVMALLAGISLLVGGIGIMNIMLASVLERTREIGIRRAVGASQGDILRLFLIEALLICFFGGVFGVLLGVGLAYGVSLSTGWETAVTGVSIVLSVGISLGIGLIFGIIPARRAALLDPIQCLRQGD